MVFRTWLKKRRKEDSPIGDLADAALGTKGWRGRSPQSLLLVMRNKDACWEAEEAFVEAMYEWAIECKSS
jgi:hypothetical protein